MMRETPIYFYCIQKMSKLYFIFISCDIFNVSFKMFDFNLIFFFKYFNCFFFDNALIVLLKIQRKLIYCLYY